MASRVKGHMKVIRVDTIQQVLGHSEIGWIVEDGHGDLIITPSCKVVDVPLNKVHFLQKDGRAMYRNAASPDISAGELNRIVDFNDIRMRSEQLSKKLLPDIISG